MCVCVCVLGKVFVCVWCYQKLICIMDRHTHGTHDISAALWAFFGRQRAPTLLTYFRMDIRRWRRREDDGEFVKSEIKSHKQNKKMRERTMHICGHVLLTPFINCECQTMFAFLIAPGQLLAPGSWPLLSVFVAFI